MSVPCAHAWCPWRPEDRIKSGSGVTDRRESSLWCWVVKPGISGRAANGLSHGTITPVPNAMLYLDLSIF